MKNAVLDRILPSLDGEAVDLHLELEGTERGWPLLGVPDWLAALAQRRLGIRSLTTRGDPGARPVIRFTPDPEGGPACLRASGAHSFVFTWRDEAAAVALGRALATSEVPQGALEIVWDGEGIVVRLASGWREIRPGPFRPATSTRDLRSIIPGQGGIIAGVAVPDDIGVPWVAAFARYAARAALAIEEGIPGPLLLGSLEKTGRRSVSPECRTLRMTPEGCVELPAGEVGTAILERLASLPTYPERALAWHLKGAATEGEIFFERRWEAAWEGDRLLDAWRRLRDDLARRPQRVEIFASETRSVRRRLATEVVKEDPGVAVVVRAAYKQAYHWVVEEVRPELSGLNPAGIEILVPETRPDEARLGDVTSWVPTLQPADEVLRDVLPLPPSKVSVRLEPRDAFVLRVRDSDGGLLLERTMRAHRAMLALDPIYPGKLAEIETGGVRIWGEDGEILAEEAVPTDIEAAFRAFQEGLTDLRRRLEEPDRLPLFSRLDVLGRVSEPDEDLPVPWERFSPPEMLHEEIYFGALAALEPLTRCVGEGDVRAPGAVVPRIDVGEGAPMHLEMRAVAAPASLCSAEPLPLVLETIGLKGDRLLAVPREVPENRIIPEGQIPPGIEIPGAGEALPTWEPTEGIPRRGFGPDVVWPLVQSLAKRIHALAWIEGISYLGRPIPVVAWAQGFEGKVTSPSRIARRRPVLLVAAGHHANEPSSNVSALAFLETLPEEGRRAIVLVVPMENPDGAALYQALAADHPRWMLHAARFNALGHEYGGPTHERPFGEGLVRARLTRDFRADFVLDDHGVPGHEWAQPFSGRSSPPLFPVAYTYPSGVFYGIGSGEGDEPSEEIRPFWERMVTRLGEDGRLVGGQAKLWDRYERYGQALAPERYPSRRDHGWPFQTTRRALTLEKNTDLPYLFVTEVADEGADPEQFDLCVQAHLKADRAVLDILAGWEGKLRGRR